jgi:hypothetical protein
VCVCERETERARVWVNTVTSKVLIIIIYLFSIQSVLLANLSKALITPFTINLSLKSCDTQNMHILSFKIMTLPVM